MYWTTQSTPSSLSVSAPAGEKMGKLRPEEKEPIVPGLAVSLHRSQTFSGLFSPSWVILTATKPFPSYLLHKVTR